MTNSVSMSLMLIVDHLELLGDMVVQSNFFPCKDIKAWKKVNSIFSICMTLPLLSKHTMTSLLRKIVAFPKNQKVEQKCCMLKQNIHPFEHTQNFAEIRHIK